MQRWLWKDKEKNLKKKLKRGGDPAYLMPLRVGLTGKNPKTKRMSPVICSRAERKQAPTHFFNMARGKWQWQLAKNAADTAFTDLNHPLDCGAVHQSLQVT